MKKALVYVAVVIIIVAVITAAILYRPAPVAPTPTPTPTPTPVTPTTPVALKGRLVIAETAPIQIDPAIAADWVSLITVNNIYDSLVALGLDGRIDPERSVAYKWEVSEDGLAWTFYLRRGIKFHTGRELKAKDVVFSLERLLRIGMGQAFVFAPYVEKAEIVDDYTVRIRLKKPYGPFLYASTLLFIVDSEEVTKNIKVPGPYGEYGDFATEWLRTNDAGSGPYRVKEHVFGERLVLEKFEAYWGKHFMHPRAPDEVVFIPVADPAAQITAFLRGELDITYDMPVETVLEWLGKPEVKEGKVGITKIWQGTHFAFTLNTKRPPLDDVHLRRALMYAFDYDAAIRAYIPDYARKATSYVPWYIPGAPQDLPPFTRNLELAREELKKSKYYGELDKHVIELWWCAEVPLEERVAAIFVTSIRELDPRIRVEVVKKPWAAILEATFKLESTPHILILLSTVTFPEAGNMLHYKFHSEVAGITIIHTSWLLDSTIDSMLNDALATINDKERFAKYRRIMDELISLAPEIIAFDYARTRFYWRYYIEWPFGEGQPAYVAAQHLNFRYMGVYPEKKAELFGK